MKKPTKKRAAPATTSDAAPSNENAMLQELGGDPSMPSAAYAAMLPDWQLIRDIQGGARVVRARGEVYLPRYPNESKEDYEKRRQHAPFVNHFSDHLRTISSKPFSRPVVLQGDVTPEMRDISEDVDGSGTGFHKFARDVFEETTAFGLAGILVDYPDVGKNLTLEEERDLSPRPYWIWYRPEDILACYTEYRKGKRYVTHVRLREDAQRRAGFSEETVRRIRILDDDGRGAVTWQLWEQGDDGWRLIGSGDYTIPEIPFRLVKFGKREWWSNATISPLADLAHMQIEHYQQSANLKNILALTGFPMLGGEGISPPVDETGKPVKIPVGPGCALFAPAIPGTTTIPRWDYIEPTAESVRVLQDQIEIIETQMSKLGMAPLVRNRGGLTATAEAVNASKAHAAAEAWAHDLRDALEQCWVYTAMWLNQSARIAPEVYIHTDFGVDLRENAENSELMDAHERGQISRDTLWDEWQRRGFLGPQFDATIEARRLRAEKKAKLEEQKELARLGLLSVKPAGGPGQKGKGGTRKATGNTYSSPASKDSPHGEIRDLRNADRALAKS